MNVDTGELYRNFDDAKEEMAKELFNKKPENLLESEEKAIEKKLMPLNQEEYKELSDMETDSRKDWANNLPKKDMESRKALAKCRQNSKKTAKERAKKKAAKKSKKKC